MCIRDSGKKRIQVAFGRRLVSKKTSGCAPNRIPILMPTEAAVLKPTDDSIKAKSMKKSDPMFCNADVKSP